MSMSDKKDHTLYLDLDGKGRGSIILGGAEIGHLVTRIEIDSMVNQPSRVTMHLVGVEVKGVFKMVEKR